MRRRYVVAGNLGQQDTESGEIVAPGGVITLDERDVRTVGLVAAGAIELEKDVEADTPSTMTCPLCVEQGKTRPAKLSTPDELASHYSDRHPGFVVPNFERGEV